MKHGTSMILLVISIDTVKAWMLTQGWWGGAFLSFALLFLCGVGLPLPEDVPLVVSGALLCHDPHGSAVNEWIIVGSLNWAGIIGGDCCLYWISRRYGMNITRAPIIGKHITLQRIDKVRGMFDRYGVGVIMVGRLFAGIRGAMVITAGTIKYNFWKFLIADSIAAVFSGGAFMLLGWWLGQNLNDAVIAKYKHYFITGAIGLVVLLVVYIAWKWLRRSKTTDAALP